MMTFRPRLQLLLITNLCYFTQRDDDVNTNERTALQKRLAEQRERNFQKQQFSECWGAGGVGGG